MLFKSALVFPIILTRNCQNIVETQSDLCDATRRHRWECPLHRSRGFRRNRAKRSPSQPPPELFQCFRKLSPSSPIHKPTPFLWKIYRYYSKRITTFSFSIAVVLVLSQLMTCKLVVFSNALVLLEKVEVVPEATCQIR